MEEKITKKGNAYFFDDNEDKFACPYLSEDGLSYLVLAKNIELSTYMLLSKAELISCCGDASFQEAAKLAVASLERHREKEARP